MPNQEFQTLISADLIEWAEDVAYDVLETRYPNQEVYSQLVKSPDVLIFLFQVGIVDSVLITLEVLEFLVAKGIRSIKSVDDINIAS